MKRRLNIFILAVSLLAGAAERGWAQGDATAPGDSAASAQQGPSSEQNNPPPPLTENPPLSGLDVPSLEPNAAPLSYVQPGATISESVDSNAANAVGGSSSAASVTRGLASLTLKRVWSHYDLSLGYAGGAGYYTLQGQGAKLLQEMDLNQRINWKRGQLSLRDSFSYLPEGNFGNAYGSQGSQNIGSLGSTPFGALLGGSVLGTLGLTPRIMNVSIVDASEYLSPKSSVTGLAGYAFTHFYGNDLATGAPFIGASQLSFQGGYNRLVTPHTQVAVMYAYQGFDFSVVGSAFHTHVVQGMIGRRISGKMDLLLGAGPQFTNISLPCTIVDLLEANSHCSQNQSGAIAGSIPQTKLGVAAIGRLRYRLTKTDLSLNYERYETSGSGLFAGAQSDIIRFSASRPLSRVWSAFTDIGYARNERLQPLSAEQSSSCVPGVPGQPNTSGLPICPGVSANTYSYGFIGGGLHRAFGRSFHGFMSYQFNELVFDHSYCGGLSECGRISNRHLVTFGLDWIPRPIRID